MPSLSRFNPFSRSRRTRQAADADDQADAPTSTALDIDSDSDEQASDVENELSDLHLSDDPVPPFFLESDIITNDTALNPRLVEADRRLIEASRELLHAVQLCAKGRKEKDGLVALLQDDHLAAAELIRDPERLSGFVSRVLEEQKEKRATLSSRFGGAVSKVYPLLSLTLGTTSAIAEATTFVPVKGAVNALSLLLAIADQEHTKSTDFLKQLDRISFQALRVAAVKQPGYNLDDILLEKATDLMTAILVFFKGSLLYLKHDFFHHLWQGVLLGPQVYADAKADLGSAINEFDQALFVQITLPHISPQPPETKGSGESATAELVRWLRSSHWEVESEFARHCRSRVKGTLGWVFDTVEFREWRLADPQSQASRSLWLKGLPGVGKSTTAAYVVQALKAQHPDACVLYFFCKAGDPALSDLSCLVRTLAAQLVPELESARTQIEARQKKDFDPTKPDPLFLLAELFGSSIQEAQKDIFVILDGLDECASSDPQNSPIKDLLKSISSLPVKLLVSSRVTPEISDGLSSAGKKELTFDESRGDIELYVKHQISESEKLRSRFEALSINAAEFLSEKSNGNFLWVRLVLENLKDKVLAKDFQTAIDTLPRDLEVIYEQVLQHLEARGHLRLTQTILACVLHSRRPLSIVEMQAMSSLVMEDDVLAEAFVSSNFGSLLRPTPTEPKSFYIVHETFRSFITTESSSKRYCIREVPSHVQLLVACLKCFVSPEGNKYAVLRSYAAEHWVDDLAVLFREAAALVDGDREAIFSCLHRFWVSKMAVRDWMRDFALGSPQEKLYMLSDNMASFSYLVRQFLLSEAPRCVDRAGRGGGLSKDAGTWLSAITSEDSSSSKWTGRVLSDFHFVWLNTNWRELGTAKAIWRAAAKLDCHLRHQPSSVAAPEKGHSWRHFWSAGTVQEPRANLELLRKMLIAAKFDDTSPMQIGNHAIALLEVGSDDCAEAFEEAIEECPGLWHLYEGLAEYYQDHRKDPAKALAALEKALEADTKPFPSAAFNHAKLVAKTRQEAGDEEGAVQAFRDGLQRAAPSDAEKYWTAMAKVWESKGNGNKMVDIYEEAAAAYPAAGSRYWEKLADTYVRGGVPERGWDALRRAIAKDPANTAKYGKEIRTIARHLTALGVWPPVAVVLTQGAKEDPGHAAEYFKMLGQAYMCQRRWAEAREQFEKCAELTDDKWIYKDIGHAYLGLGETKAALTAYKAAVSEARASTKALTLGYVHIIDEQYARATKLFKRAVAQLESHEERLGEPMSFGAVSDANEQRCFQLYLQLALCLEATGRPEEMRENLGKAVDALKPIATQMDRDKDRELVYRHEARSLFHVGLVEEKLGRTSDAKETLERAVFLFHKTTMEGDDEIQTSEAEEAAAALKRVSADSSSSEDTEKTRPPPPDLKEAKGAVRLQRRLALPYTTDWYCAQKWEPPRRRGFKQWNEVSFVNKFVVHMGDRIVVVPWGFGHY